MSWKSRNSKNRIPDARDQINAKLRQKDARSLIMANMRKKNIDARGVIAANRKRNLGDARSIINKRVIPTLPLEDKTMVMPQRTVKNELYFGNQKQNIFQPINHRRNRMLATSQTSDSQRLSKVTGRNQNEAYTRRESNMPLNLRITRDISPETNKNVPIGSSASNNSSAYISPLQGFKLQVRNLHPSVTNDDLYELFSSIGRLRQCRLLRPGVGEVVYNEREDAVNAISQYNTRELDGQPMTVQLITPSNSFSSAVQKRPQRYQKGANAKDMEVEYETVTKALFNVSQQPNARRPVNFVVNM